MHRVTTAWACLALLLLLTQLVPAQTVFGVIRGAVADSSGLPVAATKVTILNQNTREVRSVATDASGDFVFPALIPGQYTATVEAAGFKKYEKTDIILSAQERLEIGRLVLEVGQLTESVVVTAPPTPVQTANAERSTVVNGEQVAELPILSRNVSLYMRLIPGAVEQNGNGTDSYAWQVDPTAPMPHVGGVNAQFNSLSLDGISMLEDGTSGWPNGHINPDALAEVKVLVNNYSAEYGRYGNAVVNMVTRGGSQQFHGSVYTYFRNEEFNATNFFDNQLGNRKARDRYHLYGYTLSGPIYWPNKLNSRKEKLFFMWSQERTRSKDAQSDRYTMPTGLERAGDFSQTLDSSSRMPVIKDPSTGIPFPGNIIPANRINPATQKLLGVFPLPNFVDRALSRGNFNYNTGQQPISWAFDEAVGRIDYNVNEKLRVYFRGNRFTRQQHLAYRQMVPTWANVPMTDDYRVLGGVLSASYTFSPTLVNEFSFGAKGHKRYVTDVDWSALERLNRAKLGIAIPQFHPEINPYTLLPQMSFGGIPGGASLTYDGRFPLVAMYQDYSLIDGLTKVYRGHTLKAGLDFEANFTKNGDSGNFAGNFSFAQDTNNPLDSGWAYANALLGNFSSYQEATSRPRQFDYYRAFEFYVQDNWKATRKLTLDYGVRFSVRWPDWNPLGMAASFDFALFDPARQVTLYQPARDATGKRVAKDPFSGALYPAVLIGAIVPNSGNITNGMATGTDLHCPRGFMDNRGIQPGPRFGFAYDPTGQGKMVVRGGLGMGIFAGEDSKMRDLPLNPPIQYVPVIYYNNVSNFTTAGTNLFPMSVTGVARSGENPTFYNFSLGVQRSLGFGTVLDVAYVSTMGRHLWMNQNLNTLPYGVRFLPQSQDPTTGRPLPDSFLRPLMGYADTTVRQTGATSNFHSLQVQAHRRFSRGLELDGVWMWSKTMDYGDSFPLYMPRRWNYDTSSIDRAHNVKLAWVWEIPHLGKLWKNRAAWAIGDGWQLSGLASFISGAPTSVGFSLADGADLIGGGDGQRIVQLKSAVLPKSERTFYRFFDTSVFARPAEGSVGSAPRNSFRGPGINDWDVSIKRVFSIKERARIEFRVDSYNFFNHTQFSAVDATARFDASGAQINQEFGQVTSARPPRRMQGSLRFSF